MEKSITTMASRVGRSGAWARSSLSLPEVIICVQRGEEAKEIYFSFRALAFCVEVSERNNFFTKKTIFREVYQMTR